MVDVRLAEVTDLPVDVSGLERLVSDPRAGGVASFSGNVRSIDHGRAVTALTYEAHPGAAEVLAEVAREVAAAFDVIGVAVAHRVGALAIGDTALAASVSAEHRGEAFDACRALVDLTKLRLPVWKLQHFADGGEEWVNCA